MRQELDELICRTFPLLYRSRHAPMTQTAMCWGFPGDGWFSLLWECSTVIEAELAKMPEEDRPCAVQVKEKFGTLRFYMGGENDVISAAIRRAEQRSAIECEDCGAAGEVRSQRGWLYCSCELHKR